MNKHGWKIFIGTLIVLVILTLVFIAFSKRMADLGYEAKKSGSISVFCTYSSGCPSGVPIFDDIRRSHQIIGYIPIDEMCDIRDYYEERIKGTFEPEYGGDLVEDAYYYVICPSGEGWLKARGPLLE